MASNQDHGDNDFVMSEEGPASSEGDDREEYFKPQENRFDLKSRIPLIAGAIGLILMVIIVWVIFSGDRQPNNTDALQVLDSRLTQLEEKLAKLEWLDQGLARLDKQEKNFNVLAQKLDQIDAALKREMTRIGKRIDTLEKRPVAGRTAAASPEAPAAKTDEGPTAKVHVVSAGETLYRISRKYGIGLDELRRLNKLSAKSAIYPGQKLKLTP